jgi:hypothetical protein
MTLQSPPMFSERLNKLDDALNKFESHSSNNQQAQYLREALVISCQLLRSIDLDDLHEEFQTIYEKAAAEEPKWRDIYSEDGDKFEYFLHTLENQILEHVGLNHGARKRMRQYVHDARHLAPGMSPAKITRALKFLKDDVCMEARIKRLTAQIELKEEERNRLFWPTTKRITKTLAAGLVVANGLSFVVSIGIAAPVAAASGAIGGAAQFL